jgi:hypothetical protein
MWGIVARIAVAAAALTYAQHKITEAYTAYYKEKEVEEEQKHFPKQSSTKDEKEDVRDNRGRGLHSFTSQLNVSALYGIGGAREGCVIRVKGVFRVFRVCRVFLCVRHGSS